MRKNAFRTVLGTILVTGMLAGTARAADIYVSTNGTQQSPYDTWDKACTNLQAALDYAAPILGAKIYLAGNQTFSTPGGDPTSLYVWQNATNGTLSGGWDTNAAPPDTRIGGTVLKRLAASGNIRVMKMASLTNCTVESVTFREGRDVARVPNVFGGINGAGVYMSNCWNVTMADCTIAGNTNTGENAAYGEGLGLTGSSAVLTNCTIADNYQQSQYSGGTGIYVDPSSRLTVLRSFILRNKGNNAGGNGNRGMGFNNAGVLNLIETVVSGNEALNTDNFAQYGGGYNSGILTMQNCLVVSNRSYAAGVVDGLYLASGTATLVNCTFVTNYARGIHYAGGTVAMTNCIVRGHSVNDLVSVPLGNVWYSNIGDGQNNGAQGCTSVDPLFADTTYYHLKSAVSNYTGGYFSGGTWAANTVDSPAIDAGDPAAPYSREPAPNGGRNNMGYDGNTEVASLTLVQSDRAPAVANLGATLVGHRSALLSGQVTDTGYPKALACFRYWAVGSATTSETARAEQLSAFNATVAGLTPGTPYQYLVVASNRVQEVLSAVASFSTHPTPSYLYVATNGDNTSGTNWTTAYTAVQTALDRAEPNDTIYLAGQTFAGGIGGTVPAHPYNAFLIWQNATNVTVRGGYDAASGGGSNPGPRTGMTVLQRTLGNVRVLSMIDVTNCTLEQVTIRDGLSPNGNNGYQRQGCGVFLTNCWNVTLSGCIITNNTGPSVQCFGCGLALEVGSVVLTNTTVVGNTGPGDGAGGNGIYGGGIAVQSNSRITAIRSVLAANKTGGSADGGGGFWVESGGYLDLFESSLLANTNSAGFGGAGYNKGTLTMRNCLVVNNRDTVNNCGIYLSAGTSTLVNCTIVTNGANGLQYAGGAVGVTNCIVWGHALADMTNFPASTGGVLSNVGYSCFGKVYGKGYGDSTAAMAGDYTNSHCLTTDPLFAGAATNDYRLQTKPAPSPAIDAGFSGLSGWLFSDVDLAGERRRQGGAIDMGAYESTAPRGTVLLFW